MVCMCMCACVFACVHMCVCTCMCVCVHVCACVCVYARVCVCVICSQDLRILSHAYANQSIAYPGEGESRGAKPCFTATEESS